MKFIRIIAVVLAPVLILIIALYYLQFVFAHRNELFKPDYSMVDLSVTLSKNELTDEDYDIIYKQTGISKIGIERLKDSEKNPEKLVKKVQENFFNPPEAKCEGLLWWFTREDKLVFYKNDSQKRIPMVPLKKGDIILSFSTHSVGWRHGHAGLVVQGGENPKALEAVDLITNSTIEYADHWGEYSNFMVFQVKDCPDKIKNSVVDFSKKFLDDIPYYLFSGISPKEPIDNFENIKAHCDYLVWYPWNLYGYDLDSNKGRVVTTMDIAKSSHLELIQIYGLDPLEKAK